VAAISELMLLCILACCSLHPLSLCFFNSPSPSDISTLSLHDALPISFGIFSRSVSKRCHGSSLKNLYDTSKVAPPHISTENKFGKSRAVGSAICSKSLLRTLVAKSDWCASRKVVSVNNTRSEEHTSELQSRFDLVCRLLL